MENVTIKDVAKLSGYSISTVSRVISGTVKVRPEAEKRIRDAIAKTGYIPNDSARNLKRKDSREIALITETFLSEEYRGFYSVLRKTLLEKNLELSVFFTEGRDPLLKAEEIVRERRLKGVIFLGVPVSSNRSDLPNIVCLTESPDVGIDVRAEAFRSTVRLFDSGHRRVALIHDGSEAFISGYKEACEKRGISFDESLLVKTDSVVSSRTLENGYISASRLVSSGVSFDALFAANDSLACGAVKALGEAGIKVPEDCSVVGFGNTDLGRYSGADISGCRIPYDKIALAAADLLLKRINGTDNGERYLYPCDFIVGQSIKSRK